MRTKQFHAMYVLGCFEDRITFYTQQVRALILIKSLWQEQRINEQTRIAVVGAGAGGVTAAMAAAKKGCSVTLYERKDHILPLQSTANHRHLHPHIYDWPAAGSLNTDANLPILNWQADSAETVIKKLAEEITEFQAEQKAQGLAPMQIATEHTVNGFSHHGSQIRLGFAGKPRTKSFDLVILAPGFGLEPTHPTDKLSLADNIDIQLDHYWKPDGLDSVSDKPRTILIAGTGDGGLIDLARSTIYSQPKGLIQNGFNHGQMIEQMTQYDTLTELAHLFQETDKAVRNRPWVENCSPDSDLYNEYADVFDQFPRKQALLDWITAFQRQDTVVWLNYRDIGLFNLRSSLLNRTLAFLLSEAGLFHSLWGDITAFRKSNHQYQITLGHGGHWEDVLFDEVILRIGPKTDFFEAQFKQLTEDVKQFRTYARAFPRPELNNETRRFFEDDGI